MTKRMLIDANHPEETRVVILDGSKVEEFDFEAASKRPLKGNIYLAKVTRVEPSLQAAFVEYGGNRQGFLAFAEIHPDYYQIPVADRQALLAEQEADARRRQEDDIENFEITGASSEDAEADEEDSEEDSGEEHVEMAPLVPLDTAPESEETAEPSLEAADDDHEEVFVNHPNAAVDQDNGVDHDPEDELPQTKPEAAAEGLNDYPGDSDAEAAGLAEENEGEIQPVSVEGEMQAAEAMEDFEDTQDDGAAPALEEGATAAGENAAQDAQALQAQRPPQKWVRRKHYKIQEVIKRRQIILVQVVKEERGNKGAALTTYLSLAGRYCVLMPNTPRGGGISRKITNAADRKRLKSAAQGLELPDGMGLIIRTAGENRTRLEIRRDYDYLLRLWDTIREKTLSSNAPACVYEEGDLIKRVIRDLYTKDIQDVVVEGEHGERSTAQHDRVGEVGRFAQQREHTRACPHGRRGADHPEEQADREAGEHLRREEDRTAWLGQQGGRDGLVAELGGHRHGAHDDREHVPERGRERVDGAGDDLGGHRDRRVGTGHPGSQRGGVLGEGEGHDRGQERHVGGHREQQDPPQPGRDELAVLGAERGVHRATPPSRCGSATSAPTSSPTSRRKMPSSPTSRGTSSCSSSPAANARAPISGADDAVDHGHPLLPDDGRFDPVEPAGLRDQGVQARGVGRRDAHARLGQGRELRQGRGVHEPAPGDDDDVVHCSADPSIACWWPGNQRRPPPGSRSLAAAGSKA